MKIGMDMDGVLSNFVYGAQQLSKVLFSKDIGDPTKWNWMEDTLTAEEIDTFWQYVTNSPTFWRDLAPTQLGMEMLTALHKREANGDDVYFITSRPGRQVKQQTERWLQIHGWINPTVLVVDPGVRLAKGAIAKGLGLGLFVDDLPANCMDVLDNGPVMCRVVLVDTPYATPIRVEDCKRDLFFRLAPKDVLRLLEEQ